MSIAEGKYQIRMNNEHGADSGEIRFTDDLDSAMELLLSHQAWKVSWTRENGKRIVFLNLLGQINEHARIKMVYE